MVAARTEDLLHTRHVRVTRDPSTFLVRYVRSSERFATVAEFDATTDRIVEALAGIRRSRHALLVDVRRSPLVVSAEFDVAAARFAADVIAGFAKSATLVSTPVGRLQITRFRREHSGPEPFTDEERAVDYLLNALARRSRP